MFSTLFWLWEVQRRVNHELRDCRDKCQEGPAEVLTKPFTQGMPAPHSLKNTFLRSFLWHRIPFPNLAPSTDSGEFNLRISTSWRALFPNFSAPIGPYDFPGKASKLVRTGDFSPIKNCRGDPILVRNFLFPVIQAEALSKKSGVWIGNWGNKSIYLHRGGPLLLKMALTGCYGRYGFA